MPDGQERTFNQMFEEECKHIGVWRQLRRDEAPDLKTAIANLPKVCPAKENLIGLALSGGGIRSATFSLGVVQALADRKSTRLNSSHIQKSRMPSSA